MQNRQTGWFIIAVAAVLTILVVLAAIAIPYAGEMAYESQAEQRETERLRIESAVTEMLRESASGELMSIGPVIDLGQVMTKDEPPLILTDYLPTGMSGFLTSGYKYSFTADGVVMQYDE